MITTTKSLFSYMEHPHQTWSVFCHVLLLHLRRNKTTVRKTQARLNIQNCFRWRD